MHWLFSIVTDRLKALFVADVANGLETEAAAREAQRKAQLLRQAAAYREEGLDELADELQLRAERISLETPLGSVLPALSHWQVDGDGRSPTSSTASIAGPTQKASRSRPALSAPRKAPRKKARSRSR